jgi:hypothetical protein
LIYVLKDAHQLAFGHLRLDVHAEATSRVLLGRHHAAQAAFVVVDDLGLIGNRHLGIDDHREIEGNQLAQ